MSGAPQGSLISAVVGEETAEAGRPGTANEFAPLGTGHVLVQIDGAKRANSFNYYKKVTLPAPGGTPDAQPVKATNTPGTQNTFEGLPVGATIEFTVAGVNNAGEGQPSTPVPVVVT